MLIEKIGKKKGVIFLGDMFEALKKAGILSEKEVKEAEAQKTLDSEEASRKQKKLGSGNEKLSDCKTVNQFKRLAKEILQTDPDQIGRLIQKAQSFKKDPGGKKLLRIMYSMRDQMKGLKADEQERLLKRAFRRSNAKPDLGDPFDQLAREIEQD